MSSSGGWPAWLTNQTNILANIANSLGPVEQLVTGFAYLLGLMFIFKGIHCLKTIGETRNQGGSGMQLKEPLIYFLAGAMLIYFPTALAILLQTTFGSSNILQYAPVDSNNQALNVLFGSGSAIGGPLTLLIQTIGVIAFVRGWMLIARSAGHGQQSGGAGKGLIHVGAGILAMNIVATLEVVNNTLYGS